MKRAGARNLITVLALVSTICGILSGEPVSELSLTGLPPRMIQGEIRSAEWNEPAHLSVRLATDSGSSLTVEIDGVSRGEIPLAAVARLEAASFVQPSGIRRSIRLFDAGGGLVAMIALNQGAGYRVLPGYRIGPGMRLGPGPQPQRERVALLVELDRSEGIQVPPGSSVVIEGEGGRWRLTCHSATVSAGHGTTTANPAESPSGASRITPQPTPAPHTASEASPFSASFTLVREPIGESAGNAPRSREAD